MIGTPPPVHDNEKKRNSVFFRMSLYNAARKPVRENQGTPYPCTQRDLDGYLKHERDNSKARYITPAEATNQLCDWLNHFKDPDASSLAALRRLRDGVQLNPWGPDLVIKAFKDLDLAFFRGTLLHNVRVKWMCRTEWTENLKSIIGSSKHFFGITLEDAHAQCCIVLNAQNILLNPHLTPNPFRQMWRTMLHEMCHAYLIVKCGAGDHVWPDDPLGGTYSGGHGTFFRRCIHSVDRRSKRFLGLLAISSDEDYTVHS